MTRNNWKDTLEAIGFAAIIASLIFVAIETRNSTKQAVLTTQAIEISAYQELIKNITEINVITLQDPEVAALLLKAFQTKEELTELEYFRFQRAAFQRFRHGDMAFFQYQRGAIDETRLLSVLGIMRLNNPRMQDAWKKSEAHFIPAYRDYVNQLIKESGSKGL
jgi:hypothetical protein